jgi:hypothetical protein
MRDIVAQACFQHAQTLRHAHGAAIAVGQRDHAAAPLMQHAHAARQHDQAEQDEISGQETVGDGIERALLG